MKKYFSYFMLMILASVTLITSCSKDEDEQLKDPKLVIIENVAPRFIHNGNTIDLKATNGSIDTYTDGRAYIQVSKDDAGVYTTISINFKGDITVGSKTEANIIVRKGDEFVIGETSTTTNLEILKIVQPDTSKEISGKIWIVATVDGKETVIVCNYWTGKQAS